MARLYENQYYKLRFCAQQINVLRTNKQRVKLLNIRNRASFFSQISIERIENQAIYIPHVKQLTKSIPFELLKKGHFSFLNQ